MKNITHYLLFFCIISTLSITNAHAHTFHLNGCQNTTQSRLNNPQGAFVLTSEQAYALTRLLQEQPPFPTQLHRANAFIGDIQQESSQREIDYAVVGLALVQRLEQAQQNVVNEESSCARARPLHANHHPQR